MGWWQGKLKLASLKYGSLPNTLTDRIILYNPVDSFITAKWAHPYAAIFLVNSFLSKIIVFLVQTKQTLIRFILSEIDDVYYLINC